MIIVVASTLVYLEKEQLFLHERHSATQLLAALDDKELLSQLVSHATIPTWLGLTESDRVVGSIVHSNTTAPLHIYPMSHRSSTVQKQQLTPTDS